MFTEPTNTHDLSTLYYGTLPLKIDIAFSICTLPQFSKANRAVLLCKPAYIFSGLRAFVMVNAKKSIYKKAKSDGQTKTAGGQRSKVFSIYNYIRAW